jgi:carbon storage regulator
LRARPNAAAAQAGEEFPAVCGFVDRWPTQGCARPFAFDRPGDYASATGGWGVRRMGNRKVHGMLVLTRKSNQSIMIGDDVEVSVLSVMGEKVRIGIQAPQEIPVFRKEIYLEIHRDDELGARAEQPPAAGEGARAEVADGGETD